MQHTPHATPFASSGPPLVQLSLAFEAGAEGRARDRRLTTRRAAHLPSIPSTQPHDSSCAVTAAMAEVLQLARLALDHVLAGSLPPAALTRALISKLLGYGILTFSVLVKLPQVANVWRARSADGLSALSFELESWGLLVHTAYGFLRGLPFSAYGEAGILFAQNVLLLALVYKYARLPLSRALAAAIVAVGAIAAVATGRVSLAMISTAYDANNLILIGARLPQIAKNFGARSTGQLSVITFGANTLGCVARLFTTLQEGGGSAMLRSYALSLLLNSILVAQILVYGNKGVAPAKKPRGKQAAKKSA